MGKRWMPGLALLAALGLAVGLASCSQGDAVKAASTIHAYLPTVMALAGNATTMAAALDPAEAAGLQALSAKVQTELEELDTVSGAYAAAPSADGWTRMSSVVDALMSDADQGLMAALAIKNPASQAEAKVALSALDAAIHVVDGYMMAARTPQQAKVVAEQREARPGAVKLQNVVRYWSPRDRQTVAQAFGVQGEDLPAAEMSWGF